MQPAPSEIGLTSTQGAGEGCNLKVKEHDQINRIHVVDTHGGHIY